MTPGWCRALHLSARRRGELVAIAEAGHKWFRPVFDVDQPDATQVVWDFFSHSSAR
jgi:hypothetical protein